MNLSLRFSNTNHTNHTNHTNQTTREKRYCDSDRS